MTPDTIERAAQVLAAARTAGTTIDRLPLGLRPATPEDALAVQRRVTALLGATVGGWKCSVPTDARPIVAAPIHATNISSASPCVIPAKDGVAQIEPEVAFVLGRDLPPRAQPYTEQEIRAAIRETRLVIELIGARFTDTGVVPYPELLADCLANYGLVIGPVIRDGSDQGLAAFAVTVTGDGKVVTQREGRHPDRHPLLPLYWLANFLAVHDLGLRAGQIVTTGSYLGLVAVPVGKLVTIRYGDLGTLEVTLAAR